MKHFLRILSVTAFVLYFTLFLYYVSGFICHMPDVFVQFPLTFIHWSAISAALAFGVTPENAIEIVPYLIAYALLAPAFLAPPTTSTRD